MVRGSAYEREPRPFEYSVASDTTRLESRAELSCARNCAAADLSCSVLLFLLLPPASRRLLLLFFLHLHHQGSPSAPPSTRGARSVPVPRRVPVPFSLFVDPAIPTSAFSAGATEPRERTTTVLQREGRGDEKESTVSERAISGGYHDHHLCCNAPCVL